MTFYIGFCDQPPLKWLRSLNPTEVAELCGIPLDITTSTGRYLVDYWRNFRGAEVAKARLAAKPIVAKPNVNCVVF